jgi:glycosyltransferase involved in cell wall biosynthesis
VNPTLREQALALIPAYECETTVGEVVAGVRALGLEALVVDDGSRDRTGEAARDAGATVLTHEANRGKGHALVTGFRFALEQPHCEGVLTLDADGQHAARDIPALLAQLGRCGLAIGQRRLRLDPMPLASFIGNCVSTFWVSLFSGTHVPDAQCGFRLYSRGLLASVPLTGGRFETETELLLRAVRLGLEVRWVPVETIYHPTPGRRRTHFRNVQDSLRVIRVVVRSPGYPRGPR